MSNSPGKVILIQRPCCCHFWEFGCWILRVYFIPCCCITINLLKKIADLECVLCISRQIQSEMDRNDDSGSFKLLVVFKENIYTRKLSGSMERFTWTFTRLLAQVDQIHWTQTGVSKVNLRTDLGILLNAEILIYVAVYLQLLFNFSEICIWSTI